MNFHLFYLIGKFLKRYHWLGILFMTIFSFSPLLRNTNTLNQDSEETVMEKNRLEKFQRPKKSWKEIHSDVKRMKIQQQLAKNNIPSNFTFSQDGKFLYFLGVSDASNQQQLQMVSLDEPVRQEGKVWNALWSRILKTSPVRNEISKEEELLNERMRVANLGITTYEFDAHLKTFLFPLSGVLWTATLDSNQPKHPIVPKPVGALQESPRMDLKPSPSDFHLVCFVRKGDLWLINLRNSQEQRLTFTAENGIFSGVAEFIIQEEFDRYSGYWWQPVTCGAPHKSRIAYIQVDEKCVEKFHIAENNLAGNVDIQSYPRVSTVNCRVELKLAEFDALTIFDKAESAILSLPLPLKTLFPWFEYIVRCGWTPDGGHVWLQLLSRDQQRLDLVAIPVGLFSDASSANNRCSSGANQPVPSCDLKALHAKYSVETLLSETTTVWINVHNILHFLPSKSNHFLFLWASERTGFRHLYLMEKAPKDPPEKSRVVPLTKGDWQVEPQCIWVDSHRKLVYFMATKDSVLENHLYVTCLPSMAPKTQHRPSSKDSDPLFEIKRLTPLGYYHQITMSPDCSSFVSIHSNISSPQTTSVFSIKQRPTGTGSYALPENTKRQDICGSHPPLEYRPPVLFSFPSRAGVDLHGCVFLPSNFDQNQQYPTVLFVYGGPSVQLVTNEYKAVKYMRLHLIASYGFVVVMIDSRGSARRGLHFEGHIRARLGQTEIEDQVEGIEYLIQKYGYIDPHRICIHGWSYGGYLSLLGIAQRPDIFKVSIAGAPVTCWQAYDTGYTERYMNTVEANPEGYEKGAVSYYIDNIPDEENRLFIIHGLIDENVHFNNVTLFIDALIKNCKPYQLQIYPSERHGIRKHLPSEHYETTILSILQNHL
eukprot:Sdes_comp19860_c0_seq1m12114